MTSEYGKQKVVYHFNWNDEKIHAAGLKNLRNHLNTVGEENLDAVALLHGQAWTMVAKKSALEENLAAMEELMGRGVDFRICKQTLAENGLEPVDLALELNLVTSGVAELARLQTQGYTYIKP